MDVNEIVKKVQDLAKDDKFKAALAKDPIGTIEKELNIKVDEDKIKEVVNQISSKVDLKDLEGEASKLFEEAKKELASGDVQKTIESVEKEAEGLLGGLLGGDKK